MNELSAAARELFAIVPHRGIVEWAEENIDFSEDVSAERTRLDLSLSPFLIEPLKAWEFRGKIREVVVCGIEQHGKTLLEVIGILYNFIDHPCSNLCVYPSEEQAADINKTKYEPLMRRIPQLAADLRRPFSRKTDRYLLSGATMFFQGAGVKIMSKSCKIVVNDEEDQYPVTGLDAVEDSRKRTRSYSESIQYRVCTPTNEDGSIWRGFLAGSQGYWTLRCLHCGELTMRSCDLSCNEHGRGGLQFETYFDESRGLYMPALESIRLYCPKCGHAHEERDRREMNLQGQYVHRFPDRLDLRPSFQFGALASQLPSMSWKRIAEKILESGRRADIQQHRELDNSFRGLPYHRRKLSGQDLETLKRHFRSDHPDPDDVEMVFMVSDTQATFSPTGIFALDVHDNIWCLWYQNVTYLFLDPAEKEEMERKSGEAITTVEDLLNRPYQIGGKDFQILFHVIDFRGNRQPEIKAYSRRNGQVRMYAGTGVRGVRWRKSEKTKNMIYVEARTFQAELIEILYSRDLPEEGRFFLPADIDPKYQQEIAAMQPDKTKKSGHLYENWGPLNDAVHDAFDVMKMALFAVDFAVERFAKSRFLQGKAQRIRRRWSGKKVDDTAVL